MSSELNHLISQTIQRYSDRYQRLGYDVKTLGWGSQEQQEYRFSQSLISEIDFKNKELLDIGCGFGDFFNFLNRQNLELKSYLGCDLNPDLISEAKRKHSVSKARFEVKNVFDIKESDAAIADIGFMFGLLNLNWKEKFDNLEYSRSAIQKAFTLVREVLVVDFLSSHLTPDYPREDFVFYHDPKVMLEFAFSLSDNVILKHNYKPIPQKEFMLFIFKK
jgi:SAM-dependent methyltransferase